MSGIDALIAELCPAGTTFKRLADIGSTYAGLTGKSKADFAAGNARFVSYVNVFNNAATNVVPDDRVVVTDGERQNRVERGDILFTGSSEIADEAGMSSAVTKTPPEPLYLNSFCFGFRLDDRGLLEPDFAKHLFRSEGIRRQIVRTANGVTRFNVSKNRFLEVRIPLPPVDIQREIVRILDTFAELEADLEAALEAEREARRRQYEFYRTVLQSADNSEWQEVHLRDVADILVGFAFKSSRFSANGADARLVRGDNIGQGFLKRKTFKHWHRSHEDGLGRYELQAGDVVLAMDRPWIPAGLKWAPVEQGDLPALLVQRVARLRGEPGVLDQQYLCCVISSARFTAHVLANQTGNTVPHISGGAIGDFAFKLPPLPEQIKLAATLQDLDVLASNLSIALPAELNARRKQYMYYRDRLLTFEEAVA